MGKLLRALVISAVATGAAAVIWGKMQPRPPAAVKEKKQGTGPYVDADRLSEEERDMLVRELGEQL